MTASGPWLPAGTASIPRADTHALLLDDGRVLVVGNDGMDRASVRSDTTSAETWDPATSAWSQAAPLNRPRGQFAAATLHDGRVLVVGGTDLGAPQEGADPTSACRAWDATSYSSAYLFDPAIGAWSKTGSMGTARSDPSVAVLHDGRVLVAGGFFIAGGTAAVGGGAVLAAYAPGSGTSGRPAVPADVAPSFTVPPLATAELFDPGTGTWSSTEPMHYARYGAAMTVLADGRVLVAGSGQGTMVGQGGQVEGSDSALTSAELFDPATGRFTVTGAIPQGSRESGVYGGDAGSLVPLPDGDALLVGNEVDWKHGGWDVRSYRFQGATGSWTEVGTAFVAGWSGDVITETPGVGGRPSSVAAALPDGRVLVAGGQTFAGASSRSALLFDPASNRWSALPPMPAARAGGAAVTLPDGSVLLVGGNADQETGYAMCNEPLGIASAVRFVPGP